MQYFTRQLSHETTPAPALVCVEIPCPNKSLEFSNLDIDELWYSQYFEKAPVNAFFLLITGLGLSHSHTIINKQLIFGHLTFTDGQFDYQVPTSVPISIGEIVF